MAKKQTKLQHQHTERVTIDGKLLKLAGDERRARLKIFGVMLAMESGGHGRDSLVVASQKYQVAHQKVNAALKNDKNRDRIIDELHRRGLV